MTVQDLIDVLEKMDKNKKIEVFDVDHYCWLELEEHGVQEDSETVIICAG